MLSNLLLGGATMALCLVMQMALLTRALMFYSRKQSTLEYASFWGIMGTLNGVMLFLLLGNIAQVAIWAALFQTLGEFDRYAVALYHSAVNFATLGYGDIVMSERRQLLGPLEAMNGILMVGVTTAAFMTIMRDAIQHNTRGWAARHAQSLDAITNSNNSNNSNNL